MGNLELSASESIKKKKSTRKRNVKKTRFGRTLQKQRKRKSSRSPPSFIASSISTDVCDQTTISSLSTGSDRTSNLKRNLSLSKKQIKEMKRNSNKLQSKIDLLTRKLNQKNQELYKEKKAVNTLLAQTVADNKKLLDASMEKIKEAEYAKRQDIVEEIKIEQQSKSVQLIRNKQINVLKELLL